MSASESDLATITDHDARKLASQPGESEAQVLQRLRALDLHKGWQEVEPSDSEHSKTQPKAQAASTSTAGPLTLQPKHVKAASSLVSPVDPVLTDMLQKVIKKETEARKAKEKAEKSAPESRDQPNQPMQVEEPNAEDSTKQGFEADFDPEEFEDGPILDKEVLNSAPASSSTKKRSTPDATSTHRSRNFFRTNDGETTDAEPPQHVGPIKPLSGSAKKRAASKPLGKSRRNDSTLEPDRLTPEWEQTDWLNLPDKESFLDACNRCFFLDCTSAEGFNTHVSQYYYCSDDWAIPHPLALRTCVLKRDSTQPLRWACWLCHEPSAGGKTQRLPFKTSDSQQQHWWENHSQQHAWDFCRRGNQLHITPGELGQAILGLDLKVNPLPSGSALKLLPDSMPSRAKGHNTRIFNAPWSKRVTPKTHPSEQGLPWNQVEEKQLAVKPPQPKPAPKPPQGPPPKKIEVTSWGWPICWEALTLNNEDVVKLLLYPAATIRAYATDRETWHSTHVGATTQAFTIDMKDIEQHTLLVLLVKLVLTKSAAKQVSATQMEAALKLNAEMLPTWPSEVQRVMSKHQPIPPTGMFYAQSVEEYAMAAHKLEVPVNPWLLPYPTRHQGGLAALVKNAVPTIKA